MPFFTGETEWRDVANNIDHEFYLVRESKALHPYIFRISAGNAFGWSEKSIPSETVTTRETGAPPVSFYFCIQTLKSYPTDDRVFWKPTSFICFLFLF